MICLVYEVHSKGYCLANRSFNPLNWISALGMIKIKRLVLREYTPGRADQNFASLRQLILDIFFPHPLTLNNLPHDVQRLLHLLINLPRDREILIRNHYSLMTSRARRAFVCHLDKMKKGLDQADWNTYRLTCGLLPHINDWRNVIEATSPFQDVLRGGTYTNASTDQPIWFRNSEVHLMDYCWLANPGNPNPNYEYDDCEKMVTAKFPESLCVFPELLHDAGLLEHMSPQDYFCTCTSTW